MLIVGIIGFFILFWYWIIPGALLLVGGILSLLNERKRT